MLSWLSKINPNTVIGLLTLVGSFGTWLYHDIKGDKKDSFDDLMRGLGKQVIHLLLTDSTITSQTQIDLLKLQANKLLWELAGKAGIPKNSITEALADQLVEHIVGDTLTQLRALDTIPTNLNEIADKALSVAKALKSVPAQTAFDGTMTIQPDGNLKRDEPAKEPEKK